MIAIREVDQDGDRYYDRSRFIPMNSNEIKKSQSTEGERRKKMRRQGEADAGWSRRRR
jgi:hypothetical protein